MSRRSRPSESGPPATSRSPNVSVFQQNTQFNVVQGTNLDPDVIGRLSAVDKAYADLVMETWASQTTHRQEMERDQLRFPFELRKRGQLLGFLISMPVVCGGLWFLYLGETAAALGAFGVTAVQLAGAFFVEKYVASDRRPPQSKPPTRR